MISVYISVDASVDISVATRSILDRCSTDARPMLDRYSTDARVKCRLNIDRCIDRYSVDIFPSMYRPIVSVIYRWSVGKLSVDYQ